MKNEFQIGDTVHAYCTDGVNYLDAIGTVLRESPDDPGYFEIYFDHPLTISESNIFIGLTRVATTPNCLSYAMHFKLQDMLNSRKEVKSE